MSRIFNFPLTALVLIIGNCLNYVLNYLQKFFATNDFGVISPILNNSIFNSRLWGLLIPIVSFVFVGAYFFLHYRDWQEGFSWRVCGKWFLIVVFVLPWFFHFQPNGGSISPTDTFSFRSKPVAGYVGFCGTDQIIRDRDKKIIAEITLCEENIKSISFSYPMLIVQSDQGRVIYKKNFFLRWVY